MMNNSHSRESPEDMQRMQQEAIRRVQEMQSRARGSVGGNHPQESSQPFRRQEPGSSPTPHRDERREHPAPTHAPPAAKEQTTPIHNQDQPSPAPSVQGGVTNIFEALMSDSERTLILLLILLLVSEGADAGLVLALMYLII